MTRFRSFGRWWLVVTRASTIAIMPKLIRGPAIGSACSGRLPDLFLVTLGRRSFCAVRITILLVALEPLSIVCLIPVYLSRSTLDTEVLQVVRQVSALILRIVTNDMIPPVTSIATDSITIVVTKATETTYLAVVLLRAIDRRSGIAAIL